MTTQTIDMKNEEQKPPVTETPKPSTAIAKAEPKAPVLAGSQGLVLRDMDQMWRFATAVSKSGLAPKGIQTPEAIFTAVQMGLEIGLTPMAALQNIAVINGRPSVWGDALLAVIKGSGELTEFQEWFEQDGKKIRGNPTQYTDSTTAWCFCRRGDSLPTEVSFSVADAKRGHLWGKEGPWSTYPFRMLRMRARAFAMRDLFPDKLRGILTTEEARDVEMRDVTPRGAIPEAPSLTITPAAEPERTQATSEPETPKEESQEPGQGQPDPSGQQDDPQKETIEAIKPFRKDSMERKQGLWGKVTTVQGEGDAAISRTYYTRTEEMHDHCNAKMADGWGVTIVSEKVGDSDIIVSVK